MLLQDSKCSIVWRTPATSSDNNTIESFAQLISFSRTRRWSWIFTKSLEHGKPRHEAGTHTYSPHKTKRQPSDGLTCVAPIQAKCSALAFEDDGEHMGTRRSMSHHSTS